MNPARPLFSAVHGGAESHGHGNVRPAEKAAAFQSGFVQRYLRLFPENLRVPAGVATAVLLGVGLFRLSKPSTNKLTPNNQTRTPEWEKETEKYLDSQRISPAHKKSG